jgi:mannosyltransferase OCH1-like enzyme
MIPKIIHYCWFGKNPHNEMLIQCLKGWRVHLPDYKIIEWNEENFDININPYVKEAYNANKFAFVSDYVRLFVLNKYGGIYLDTDVEVIRNIDSFLVHPAFSGFEDERKIQTAIIGSSQKNEWIKAHLDYYDNIHFIKEDGSFDVTTNVEVITKLTEKLYDINLKNQFLNIPGVVCLYPKEYFSPKTYETGITTITENTYIIHHFNGSWLDEKEINRRNSNHRIIKFFGESMGNVIISVKQTYCNEGLYSLINKIFRKLGFR